MVFEGCCFEYLQLFATRLHLLVLRGLFTNIKRPNDYNSLVLLELKSKLIF